MATLIFFVLFLGFWFLYNTSKKADLNKSSLLEKWIHAHPTPGKFMGLLLLGIVLAACILYFGTGAGIFAFFVMLMTASSIIVLLAPLRIINFKVISSLFIFFFLFELILT